MPDVVTDADIRRAAMDLLARREHGAKELREKLLKRFRRVKPHAAEPDDEPFLGSGLGSGSGGSDAGSGAESFIEVDSENGTETEVPLEDRIFEAVSRLSSEGLQSDERLAEAFIRARANRGQGPVKIKAELRQKGIADALIGAAFEQCEQDWFELAAEVASRKFSGPDGRFDPEPKARARRSRFLQQRGFSFDHISAIDG